MTVVTNRVPGADRLGYVQRGGFNAYQIVGAIWHPKDTPLMTEAQKASPKTRLNALLTSDTDSARGLKIGIFENEHEDNGEGVSYETRGQSKREAQRGTFDRIFLHKSNYSEHKELTRIFSSMPSGNYYVALIVNAKGKYALMHTTASNGDIYGFSIKEVTQPPYTPANGDTAAMYKTRIALDDIEEFNTADFTYFLDDAGIPYNPFGRDGLDAVEIVEVKESTASASNGVHDFIVTGANGEENLVEKYKASGELMQAGAWSVTLTDGTAVTVSSVALVLDGTEAVKFKLTLDQTDYTNGDTAYVELAVPSTIEGYTGRYLRAARRVEISLVK